MNKLKLSILVTALVLTGCASSVNQRNAAKYWDAAIAARDQGNWSLARSNWSKMIINGDLGGLDQRNMSIAYYEYGRASGILCMWEEAEKGLKKSLEIDRSNSGPIHLPLIELARLNFDRGKYGQAAEYFEEAKSIVDSFNAETRDPLGYAEFLDELSESIEKSNADGKTTSYRERADELRAAFPNGTKHTDRTPYGTQCTAS